MMSREWQPGDVAMVRWRHFGPTRALFNGATRRWEDADGATFDGDEDELTIRPLVVIDPDSPADCERLAQAWEAQKFADLGSVAMTLAAYRMQAALREFADPKPPKPDEPTGLGAVVEDGRGERFVIDFVHDDGKPRWYGPKTTRGADVFGYFEWADIDAVRVLSEGVTS